MGRGPKTTSTKAAFSPKPITTTQVFIFSSFSAVRRHVGMPWAKCSIFPHAADDKRSKPGLGLTCTSLSSGSSQLHVYSLAGFVHIFPHLTFECFWHAQRSDRDDSLEKHRRKWLILSPEQWLNYASCRKIKGKKKLNNCLGETQLFCAVNKGRVLWKKDVVTSQRLYSKWKQPAEVTSFFSGFDHLCGAWCQVVRCKQERSLQRSFTPGSSLSWNQENSILLKLCWCICRHPFNLAGSWYVRNGCRQTGSISVYLLSAGQKCYWCHYRNWEMWFWM